MLKDHMQEVHKSNLTCPYEGCGRIFAFNSKLIEHLGYHTSAQKQVCHDCGKILSSSRSLDKHIETVHLKVFRFYCDICDYHGSSKHHIRRHVSCWL